MFFFLGMVMGYLYDRGEGYNFSKSGEIQPLDTKVDFTRAIENGVYSSNKCTTSNSEMICALQDMISGILRNGLSIIWVYFDRFVASNCERASKKRDARGMALSGRSREGLLSRRLRRSAKG